MDGWSGIEAVAAAVGAGTGLGGLIVAFIANRRTKQANEFAKAANDLASQALRKARKANKIAEHANELSEDANSIARRQAIKQSDPSHVEWIAKWDKDASVLRVENDGRDVALRVSVLVKSNNLSELIRGEERISRGDGVSIPFPQVPNERAEYEAAHPPRDPAASAAASVLNSPRPPFFRTVELDVHWFSEAGNARQQVVRAHVN